VVFKEIAVRLMSVHVESWVGCHSWCDISMQWYICTVIYNGNILGIYIQ